MEAATVVINLADLLANEPDILGMGKFVRADTIPSKRKEMIHAYHHTIPRLMTVPPAYFKKAVAPHVNDAWIDAGKCDERDRQIGVVGYEIRDWISAYAGYRGSYTDYSNDGFVWDVTMYGPIVGFELKF